MKTVFLTGFMGSGKTTFGKKLAPKLKAGFIDLDALLCSRYGVKSIKQLIDIKGFEFFRIAENEALKQVPITGMVVSTGGGTPCYYNSLQWMKENGTVVYLDVNEDVLFSRLKTTDLEERPLLKGMNDDGLKQFIHDKLTERLPYYEQAHIRFNPVGQKMEELVELLK